MAASLIAYSMCLPTNHDNAAWVSSKAMLFTNGVSEFFDTPQTAATQTQH